VKSSLRKLLALLALTGFAHGADLTSSGDWVETINAADLVSGAGSALLNPESVSGVTTLSVSNPLVTWRVRVHRTSGSWMSNVEIWVKRSSGGSGLGTISGGTSYMQLTGTDVDFFSGTLARSNISLQFKVTGLSLTVTPGTYQSPIVFTVVSP